MLNKHLTNIKQRVTLTVVDTTTRTMQGTLRDGGSVSITVWEVPASFVWPLVGEQWTVTREYGMWLLGHRVESQDDDHSIEDLQPGAGKVNADTVVDRQGRVLVAVDTKDIAHGEQLVWDSVVGSFVPSSRLSPAP